MHPRGHHIEAHSHLGPVDIAKRVCLRQDSVLQYGVIVKTLSERVSNPNCWGSHHPVIQPTTKSRHRMLTRLDRYNQGSQLPGRNPGQTVDT
jgi:hypothetical protein